MLKKWNSFENIIKSARNLIEEGNQMYDEDDEVESNNIRWIQEDENLNKEMNAWWRIHNPTDGHKWEVLQVIDQVLLKYF